MSLSTYKKRSGTSDRGKEYEWLLCAFYSLNLSTSPLVSDFELFSNNEFFGDFDDITLRVKFVNEPVKIFLLQLKHSEKTKTLSLNSLTSPNGDLSLSKYRKSFENIVRLENFHFILYVNKTAKFKDKTKVTVESREIFIRQHSCVGGNVLNTNTGRNCSVFRFESNPDEEFFANFYLYVNQQNDSNLKQSISDLLKVSLYCDIYTTFVEYIRGWWAGNFKLTKYDVVAKLAELVLSPMIKTLTSEESNEATKLIEETILKFDLTLVEGRYGSRIARIWSKTDEGKDLKKMSMTCLKYGLTTRGISKMSELSLEKQAKVLWFMDELPLLIQVDGSKKEQIDSILLLLGRCKKKKRIILWGYSSKGNFTNWKVFRDLSDISEADRLRETLTETLRCSLQGKKTITLKELGAFDSKLTSTFRVDQLLEIATNENFLIGEPLEVLPSVYIPRYFYKILLNYSVIDDLSKSKILLSCNGLKSLAQSKYNKRSVDISCKNRQETFIKYNIFISENEFTKRVIIKEFSGKTTSHHFRVVNGQNLQWLNSTEIGELDEHRKTNSGQIFGEGEIEDHLHKKIRILTSHTGTGKTTFLNRIKNESPPNYFVVKLDLKDHADFFAEKKEVWSYIVQFKKGTDDFEREMLENFDKDRIILLWDNFDELQLESRDGFVNAVKELFSMGVTQWIAAQHRFQKFLEHNLGAFSLSLLPFREEDRIRYIQNRCGLSNDKTMSEFVENMKIIDNQEYLGVPLQLYILTEIFSDDSKLLEKIYTLTDMCATFIDGKYNHFLKANTDFNYSRSFGSLIENAKSYRLGQYKIAALKTYLPTLYRRLNLKNNQEFLDDLKEGDFLGLIEKVDEEGNFVFEHQIFGEFLTASYLAEYRPSGFDKFIFREEHRNIRFMFDLLLAGNELTFIGILYKRFDHFGSLVKDKGGRNPLHLICSYGKSHPHLTARTSEDGYLIEAPGGSTIHEDEENLKLVVKDLSRVYNPYERDALFDWTCFDYADRSCSLGLLESFEDLKEVVPNLHSYTSADILYYSIRLNYAQIFSSVEQLPYVEYTTGDTFLHLAAEFNRENQLTKLLNHSNYKTSLNKLNRDGWSPLHIATFNGNLPLIKLLLNKGATFMLRQPSVMSLAASKGRRDIIEFFLECGCSPNEFYHTNHFTTSIYQAIGLKHNDIFELLLRNGAKLYCVNRQLSDDAKPNPFGMNLFHMLLENEQFEEAEMVLKKGIHIDSIDNEGRTAFHHAALNNQERVVRYLLSKGANWRILNKLGESPLHSAAKAGSVEVARILVSEGSDINLQDSEGLSPLNSAVLAGEISSVKFLVEVGVDPNVGNKFKRTPMHMAAQYDQKASMELLYLSGGDLEARDLLYGRTPLHFAAWFGSDDCVKFLLEKGVSPDCACNFGYTPLHLAIEETSMDSCRILLEAGASVSIKNRNGHTPLDMIERGYLSFCRLLMDYDPVPLHTAVSRSDLQFINELTDMNCEVNGVDDGENTPLHVATRCKDAFPLVQMLLRKGGDVMKKNRNGDTPLHSALQSEYHEERVIKLLLNADGMIVNSATVRGATPLHLAAQNSSPDWESIVELLLKSGATIDVMDDIGFTPLHYAASSGNLQIVTLLMKAGSDVNKASKTGRTPLHLASTRGHLDIVNFLLTRDASVLVEDNCGDTPLHDALKSEEASVFGILFLRNQNFDVRTNYLGRTVLHVAAKKGLFHLVKYFLEMGVEDRGDNDGSTALEESLFNRHYDVFDYLSQESDCDVNKFNKRYGKYPLHVVASTGTLHLVELFLEKGARTDVVDDDGNTPLHIAFDCNQTDIFTLLLNQENGAVDIRNKKGQTVLHKAMELERDDIVEVLLAKGANVDIADSNGNTPFDLPFNENKLFFTEVLSQMKTFDINKPNKHKVTLFHLAVALDSFETIEWLIQKGASINCEDEEGDTPLHYAVSLNPDVLPLLLEKYKDSFDLEKKNKEGETILHMAAESSPESVVEILKMGGSPHATTRYGATPLFYALKNPKSFVILWEKTPEVEIFSMAGHMTRTVLHEAAHEGDLESVLFFLNVGLKINEVDNKGSMPLNEAAREEHLQVLEAMFENNTNDRIIDICDANGRSLLHFAASRGNFDLVKMLLRFKARTELCDGRGYTAADLARESAHVEIYEFLKEFQQNKNKIFE